VTILLKVIDLECLYWPQQPLEVSLTALMAYSLSRSTRHQGDGSLDVSVHLLPSWMTSVSPSLALAAGPPRIDEDWFAGFLNATFVPANITRKNSPCQWKLNRRWYKISYANRNRKIIAAGFSSCKLVNAMFWYHSNAFWSKDGKHTTLTHWIFLREISREIKCYEYMFKFLQPDNI